MSKESFIGGDYIETTGGSAKNFAGANIENSSLGNQFTQNGLDTGVTYNVNEPPPKINLIAKKIIRIEITNEITGYTIQGLKGLDYNFYDPAVVVPTYKVNIFYIEKNIKGEDCKTENKGEFDVTRDAWYSLGKNKDGKYELLNRAFVPDNYERNLYGLHWIPSYPNISARYVRSDMDAFIFTRFGSRKIPAKQLRTQTRLDGKNIDSPRKDQNFATDVMIHIGGSYEMKGYDHLGGSYGCFAYIPKDDIYSTPELAEKASDNDDYDDIASNSTWKEITNKIKLLAFEDKKEMQVILKYRDESKVYFPPKILNE
ncbi:hypothetical protein K0U91_00475 [Chryseobacterium chendengshani]|uniref:hypothetical protein n=1 Tax=Chryseobacterium sp. LJ668 TaxID=2864040 RepID=UPI001C68E684|nr:hypothetical protein [Chryseobacterium sp. LJ668]MBW8523115.1 hypothetical protein [Chryseobacterium sp. LJ668]QYK16641.1 hypothetical protein K0U91_00475 [Chryseobacterium sp. LJ668]